QSSKHPLKLPLAVHNQTSSFAGSYWLDQAGRTTAMYGRWQSRKRQHPDLGPCEGYVHDEAGKEVRNERGAALRTRRRADGSVGQDVRWTAILVEGKRIDGRPCHREHHGKPDRGRSSAPLLLGRGA